jgi:hypothetical protein
MSISTHHPDIINYIKIGYGSQELLALLSNIFLPAPSMTFAVTTNAKRNQVVHHIATELAPAFHVMDLQASHGTALLAPPAISFQYPVSNDGVFFRVQLEPRLLLTYTHRID